MIGYQYPISRKNLLELESLKTIILSLASEENQDMPKAILNIGNLLFKNSYHLHLDEDVSNLCEFSQRIGKELLNDSIRLKWYEDNCWTIGPRDSKILTFKENGKNSPNSEILEIEQANAAMVLYFSVPLQVDPEFKIGASRLINYIESNNLWSFLETEKVRNSRPATPFNLEEYIKKSKGN